MPKNILITLCILIVLLAGFFAISGKRAAAPQTIDTATTSPGSVPKEEKSPDADLSNVPKSITITGTSECLPHKNPGEIQTMECAYGIKDTQTGKHYAVNTSAMSNQPANFPTGVTLRIQGVMVPANQLNSDMWQKYDIAGIISATNITEIK